MTENRKPWWKRKRSIAAVLLWIVVSYPLSFGPAMYAWYADWIPVEVVTFVYRPIFEIDRHSPHCSALLDRYVDWWFNLYVRNNSDRFASPSASGDPYPSSPVDPAGEEVSITPVSFDSADRWLSSDARDPSETDRQ